MVSYTFILKIEVSRRENKLILAKKNIAVVKNRY